MKVFKDELNKKLRLCIYDLRLTPFSHVIQFRIFYILIYFFLGGGVIQQQNNFNTMHVPTLILKEHSSFSDLIVLPMTYDVTRIIKKTTSANMWSLCSFIVTGEKYWLIKDWIEKKMLRVFVCKIYLKFKKIFFFFFFFLDIFQLAMANNTSSRR